MSSCHVPILLSESQHRYPWWYLLTQLYCVSKGHINSGQETSIYLPYHPFGAGWRGIFDFDTFDQATMLSLFVPNRLHEQKYTGRQFIGNIVNSMM